MAGAVALGFVHQLVGAVNELRREPPRDEPPLRHPPEAQADDADVDTHRLHGEPLILGGPVVALDRFPESLGDGVGLVVLGQVGDEEAELVAAQARVQFPRFDAGPFLGKEVVGADLLPDEKIRDIRCKIGSVR